MPNQSIPEKLYAPPAPHGNGERRERPLTYESERRSVLLVLFLTGITLLIYPTIWYLRRRRFFDSLASDKKLGALAALPLAAFLVGLALPLLRLPHGLDQMLHLGFGAAWLTTAFRARAILRSDFARTRRQLDVSSAGTLFFGPIYLQHAINEAADTPARETRQRP